MNFSVHLNDERVNRLAETAKARGKTRNALISEAVSEWLKDSDLSSGRER